MTIDELKQKSVTELKALAFDQVVLLENTQRNLQGLNQLIAEKEKVGVKDATIVN